MELLSYNKENSVIKTQLTEQQHSKYWEKASCLRSEIIDKLTSYDDELANLVIKSESLEKIATVDVVNALRRVTQKQVRIQNFYFEIMYFNVHKDCHSSITRKFLQKCRSSVFNGRCHIILTITKRS